MAFGMAGLIRSGAAPYMALHLHMLKHSDRRMQRFLLGLLWPDNQYQAPRGQEPIGRRPANA